MKKLTAKHKQRLRQLQARMENCEKEMMAILRPTKKECEEAPVVMEYVAVSMARYLIEAEEVEGLLPQRPFTIASVDGPRFSNGQKGNEGLLDWREAAGEEVERGVICEFNIAEEVIGLLDLAGGDYLVGIGESLRPFWEVYRGKDAERAALEFTKAIICISSRRGGTRIRSQFPELDDLNYPELPKGEGE